MIKQKPDKGVLFKRMSRVKKEIKKKYGGSQYTQKIVEELGLPSSEWEYMKKRVRGIVALQNYDEGDISLLEKFLGITNK